jgi:hypothetical protein
MSSTMSAGGRSDAASASNVSKLVNVKCTIVARSAGTARRSAPSRPSSTLSASDRGKGLLDAVVSTVTGGPLGLSLHAILGILLLVTGISAAVRAILLRCRALVAITVVALIALLIAAISGAVRG